MTYTIFPLKVIRNGEIVKTVNYPTFAAADKFIYKMDKDAETVGYNMYAGTTPFITRYNAKTNTIYTTTETPATKVESILAHANLLNEKDRENYLKRAIALGDITINDLNN